MLFFGTDMLSSQYSLGIMLAPIDVAATSVGLAVGTAGFRVTDHRMVCSTSETGGMKQEHEPHDWKEGRRKLSLELSQPGWKQKELAAALG
ncbi:MAG TPA: hypothetical protein VF844_23020 [Ktedonobacteraceae bacterium]